jgi:hypothetical protein
VPRGLHLGIGLNRVDPAHYGGWAGGLNACVADAWAMQQIARDRGMRSELLLNEKATAGAILGGISDLAAAAAPGDLVVVSYSGHGGQVPDVNGDEPTHMDSTWVAFDRQVLDDEIHAALGSIREGVRVLLVSDSCHSGTIERAVAPGNPKGLPAGVAAQTYAAHRALYDAQRIEDAPALQASVIALSACRDDQTALDGETNGAFTEALLAVYAGGFAGSYRQFYNAILARVASQGLAQVPQFSRDGAHSARFLQEDPFTV